ncbi:MAG: hypothetical protein KDB23_17050, partial [Planctomycetales bacterium]|nr:hypothetical protein [Planctomycetales bacterium]
AGILREKQRLLEQRESELNARTALLENELRQARMKQYRDLPSLDEPVSLPQFGREAAAAMGEAGIDLEQPTRPTTSVPRADTPPPATPTGEHVPFEWTPFDVEAARSTSRPQTPAPAQEPASGDVLIETDLAAAARQAEADFWREHTRQQPPLGDISWAEDPAANSPRVVNTELQAEYEHLEQQRRLHRQREFRLERREKAIEQLHEEVTTLHREALELRLAAEQIWNELAEEHPQDQLGQSLTEIRNKLTDHYRMANDTLARRRDELHQLRAEVSLQEQRVRQQRRDIQLWADRRYDEIEARTVKLLMRERELDQIEGDFNRQTLEWQKQREAFRREIEMLTKKAV